MHLLLIALPIRMSPNLFDCACFLSIDQLLSRSEVVAAKSEVIRLQSELLSKETQLSEAKLAHEAAIKQLKVDNEVINY